MPKAKKIEALTPDRERPYRVPENWFWTDIESINQYSASYVDPMKQPDTTFELYSVPSSADGYPEIITGSGIGSAKQAVKKNDVLLCKINPRINRVWKVSQYTDNPLLASSEWIIIRNPAINPDYLMYCLRTQYFREFMLSNVSGVGGSLMRAQPKLVKKYPVPVAPAAEQRRIVKRIESLFARLDEARERAQDALDSSEKRKAAILRMAFSGELTARWRKEHGAGTDSWENRTLAQLAKQIKAGGDKPDDFTETADETHSVPVVGNGVTDEGIVGYTSASRFSGETVTVAGRGTIGFSVYRTYPFFPIVRLIVIEPRDFVKAAYIKYAFDAFPESGTGSSIPQLTVPVVKEKVIPLPKLLDEQSEIVRILDNLLAKERQAGEAAKAVLEQIELIKMSILARAFRGELGTNDPAEESAAELAEKYL